MGRDWIKTKNNWLNRKLKIISRVMKFNFNFRGGENKTIST